MSNYDFIGRVRVENPSKTDLVELMRSEISRLQSELDRAKDRERKAFEAGIRAGWDDMVNNPDDIDFDQAWQQYRSQDDSEGRPQDESR